MQRAIGDRPYTFFRYFPQKTDFFDSLRRPLRAAFGHFLYRVRMELSTHSMATPESANTASHMEA